MGGWGRIEIEPERCGLEDHFLTVLVCTDAGVQQMPAPCALLREPGLEGVKLTQGTNSYEVRFRSLGEPGGSITRTEPGGQRLSRPLAGEVQKEFRRIR